MDKINYICSCYLNRNIFLKSYNLHVNYENEKQLSESFQKILFDRGCKTEHDLKEVKQQVLEEIDRRSMNGKQSRWRKNLIMKTYKPLFKDIYKLQDSFLTQEFLDIVNYVKESSATKCGLMSRLTKCKASEVFIMPVFTSIFCDRMVKEIQHFENSDLPKGRPNSMNTTGVLLEEIGFYPDFIDKLRCEYLSPLITLLYPEWSGTSGLDSQRAFVVTYNSDNEDSDLGLHFDNAEVTINVSLDTQFEGGDLFFGAMKKEPNVLYSQVLHRTGHGVLHRGQHFHGAMPLENGQRYNLIIWMRSSAIRNKLCPMCDRPPDLVITEGDGDGFTNDTAVDVCKLV